MKGKEWPLVSVVVPAYNAEKYLGKCLESLLGQTYSNLEIIVVDDGSTDSTAAVAKSFNVRYLHQENQGVGVTMNVGFKAATGDLIASLDADDLWEPLKIEEQVECLSSQPTLDMVFGHMEQFVCPSAENPDQLIIPEHTKVLPGYSSTTILVKKEALLRVGLFRTDLQYGGFIDWYNRASDLGLQHKMLPQVLAHRRVHESNLGHNQAEAQEQYMIIIKERLRQRNS